MLKLYQKNPKNQSLRSLGDWEAGPQDSWGIGFFVFFGTVTAFCNFGIGFIVFFCTVTAFCNFAIGFIDFIGTVIAFWIISFRMCRMSSWVALTLAGSKSLPAWSKSSIWVLRVLGCGRGALMLCLSKCTKIKHRRNLQVLKSSSKSSIWVPRLLICGPGALRLCLSRCSKRNHLEVD